MLISVFSQYFRYQWNLTDVTDILTELTEKCGKDVNTDHHTIKHVIYHMSNHFEKTWTTWDIIRTSDFCGQWLVRHKKKPITFQNFLWTKCDEVITWQCFLHYRLLMRGIHWSLVNSPHKESVTWSYDVSFIVSLNKVLYKQSSCWWLDMLWCPCYFTSTQGWVINICMCQQIMPSLVQIMACHLVGTKPLY